MTTATLFHHSLTFALGWYLARWFTYRAALADAARALRPNPTTRTEGRTP